MTPNRKAFIVGALSLFVAGSVPAQGAEPRTLPIGVFNALTGSYAFGGIPVQNGIKMALEDAAAKGELGSIKLRVIEGDTAGDKGQTINLVNKFAQRDNVVMILGPTTSIEASAGAPVANDLQVPMLVDGSSKATLAAGPWSFKIQSVASDIMTPLAKHAVDALGVKRMTMIFDRSNDGYVQQTGTVRDHVKAAGVTIVSEEGILGTDSDFLALATKLSNQDTDAVFIAVSSETAANIIIQLRQAGMDSKVKMMGPSTLSSHSFIKTGGKAVEGTIIVSDYFVGNPSQMNQAFVEDYTARYKAMPDNWAALGYTIGQMAVKAIKSAGPDPDRIKIRDGLKAIRSAPTILGDGTFRFDEERNPTYGAAIITVNAGQFKLVK